MWQSMYRCEIWGTVCKHAQKLTLKFIMRMGILKHIFVKVSKIGQWKTQQLLRDEIEYLGVSFDENV